ncbi:class I SAM-dependent methyltransferase [Planctobacterium marinum]
MIIPLYTHAETLPDFLQTSDFGVVDSTPEGLSLVFDNDILGLKDFSQPKVGAVIVDFTADAIAYRASRSSIKNEAIAKAAGLKGNTETHIIDATAGLGRDSFMLMTLGAQVSMLERSPVVAALLQDGLRRAEASRQLGPDFTQRLQFKPGQAYTLLTEWHEPKPDVIYLDPMFPHKKKSALVKKEMRLFQQLLGHDEDADVLLPPALTLAQKRVVVKRPDYAPFLAGETPSMQIKSKKHRFDVYLTNA